MSPHTSRVLRRHAVQTLTGLSRSTIYARMGAGTFPAAIRLGARSVGWLMEEIEAWIAARIAESRPTLRSEVQR
jgi:prophage regulatory protein